MTLSNKAIVDCDRRNASNCDRCAVNLLRLQWSQNRKHLRVSSSSQSVSAPFKRVLDQMAMIIVAVDGQIQFTSQRAAQLLSQYSLPHASQTLPDPIHQWLQQQIAQLPLHENEPSLSSPLHLEEAGQQLIVRLVSGSPAEHFFLVLEDRELPCLSISALKSIGLTNREAEILFWVAKDKSNAEIAKLLNSREGTVRKHLENLHRKLGVQTRTAAVMVALERLGLLQA